MHKATYLPCGDCKVLVDLGYTEELYKAEHDEKVALAKRLGEETSGSDDDDDDEGDEDYKREENTAYQHRSGHNKSFSNK
eukprot:1437697-Amphidinium_carterae.1